MSEPQDIKVTMHEARRILEWVARELEASYAIGDVTDVTDKMLQRNARFGEVTQKMMSLIKKRTK